MKEKNQFIQLVRGLCIIAVVLIHILFFSENNHFINHFNISIRTVINFCVAIFVFISGYLNNTEKIENNPRQYLIKRLKRLYIPFIVYSILYSVINNNISFVTAREAIKSIFKILLGTSSAQLYYIIILLELTFITPFLIKIINRERKYEHYICLSITPIYLLINLLFNLVFDKAIPRNSFLPFGWFIYYYLGLYANINNYKIKLNRQKQLFVALIILLIINVVTNNFEYKFINYSYVTSQIKLTNMFYVILILLNTNNFKNILKSSNIIRKILIKLGNESFGIYFIHIFVLKITTKILELISLNYFIYVLVQIVSNLIISYFIIKILKKVANEKIQTILGI